MQSSFFSIQDPFNDYEKSSLFEETRDFPQRPQNWGNFEEQDFFPHIQPTGSNSNGQYHYMN